MLKTKKLMLLPALLLVFFLLPNAIAINCTMNVPHANIFDDGTLNITFNVTANWEGAAQNVTNVTWTVGGTSVFSNTTVNGTLPKTDGGGTAGSGGFTFTINSSNLSSGGLTAYATCYNSTSALDGSVSRNSSSITYNVDRTNPLVTVQAPRQGETIAAKGTGLATISYTPTDSNLGNSSLFINNFIVKSSTSATATSNLTSGSTQNSFTMVFASNNNSNTLKVEIKDLAGRKTNSSEITFSMFREGSAEPVTVFVTPSGEVISTPATPKGKAITKTPLSSGNIGNVGGLLSNPIVWGGIIVVAVGGFIWYQNRKR